MCTSAVLSGAAFCSECGERIREDHEDDHDLTGVLLDGRFSVEEKLGAGGFGAIYRAIHVPSGRVVALKVLHADLASDAHLNARFRREAAALAKLSDPHTVTTYELGEDADGTLFIVMELLEGRTLFVEFHEEGPLPWRRALKIMRGVCSSLVEAHAHGIVHRDLKPANIHLERRGRDADFVKVLDFGVVKVIDSSVEEVPLTRVGQAVGTLEYMSPEQIIGGRTDGRSDLYTLGVVVYELITGHRPFYDAAGPTGLMTALMTLTAPPLSALFHRGCIPPVVDAMIARCLAREPDERFASAKELAAAIDAILKPAVATPVPRTTVPGSGIRPQRPAPARAPIGMQVIANPAPGGVRSNAQRCAGMDELATVVTPMPAFEAALFDPPLPGLDPIAVTFEPVQAMAVPWETRPRMHYLVAPPEHFEPMATGSTVGPVIPRDSSLEVREAAKPPRKLRFALWASALLGVGICLGALAAALVA